MDITFVTSANTDTEAMQLLSELGLPFKKKNEADEKPKVENKPPVTEAAVEETPEAEAAVEETPEAEANEDEENKKEN